MTQSAYTTVRNNRGSQLTYVGSIAGFRGEPVWGITDCPCVEGGCDRKSPLEATHFWVRLLNGVTLAHVRPASLAEVQA